MNIIFGIIGTGFLVIILPFVLPLIVFFLVRQQIARTILNCIARKNTSKLLIYRGTQPELAKLVDEFVTAKISVKTSIIPQNNQVNSLVHYLFRSAYNTDEPMLVVTSSSLKRQTFPLKNSLLKLKAGNPIRIKNILFRIKMLGLDISDDSPDEILKPTLESFKAEISEELLHMATSQLEAQNDDRYLIPIDEYEEEFISHNDPTLDIAWRFIDAWVDEANHNFQGFHYPIKIEEWPEFARSIAESINTGVLIRTDIQAYFTLKRPEKTKPWYQDTTTYKLIGALLFLSLVAYRCTHSISSKVCHQINMKEC